MKLLHILLVFSSIILSVFGDDYDRRLACIDGIRYVLTNLRFNETKQGYWESLCTNNNSVVSMWATAKKYCTPVELDFGSHELGEFCTEYGEVELIPYTKVLPILTDEYIASLHVLEFEESKDEEKLWKSPVILSKTLAAASKRTLTTFYQQYELHKDLGWSVYGFWALVLLLGMTNRLLTHLFRRRSSAVTNDLESTSPTSKLFGGPSGLLGAAQHWIRTNLIIPATFGTYHQRLFWWCMIPTRIETIVVGLFWILNFVICCVSYEIFYPNVYYTIGLQKWRYISDRTGIISYANLLFMWMFSGRNNIFIWLTGWSFSTFNIFHRHTARIATIQAIVHSVGWSVMEIRGDGYAESWKQEYWYMGAMATIVMSLLLVFSSVIIRQRSYEIFLLIHIAFSVLVLVGLFYHTAVFTDGEYDHYLWPPVAIWSFDRAARLVRIAYCNLHIRLSGAPVTTTATATYDAHADLIRLEVTPGSSILKPAPGQHYYLYQPLRWKGWENHPFTLSSWTVVEDDANTVAQSAGGSSHETKEMNKEMSVAHGDATSSHSSDAATSSHMTRSGDPTKAVQATLSFLIRPFDSWTARLRDECLKSSSGSINTHILLEGPYGEKSPADTFENVVFIVGGTGIAGALPYLQEFVAATSPQARGTQAPRTRTRDVTIVWAAKQSAMLLDVANRELQPLLRRSDVNIQLHATKDSGTVSPVSSEGKGKSPITSSTMEISYCRPNIQRNVLDVMARLSADGYAGGRTAVLTCGPASMADEARAAVHKALKDGNRNVHYYEEAFGW